MDLNQNDSVKDDADEQEPDEQTRKQVEMWNKRVTDSRETPQFKMYLQNINKHRRYVRGRMGADDDEVVRTNLIYATMASQLPRIYAKNPEIAITPSEAVDQRFYGLVKKFSQTLEIALNKQLDKAKLKKRAKASVRSSMTTSLGWVKIIYQRDINTDPQIQSRMNDVQDNLRRLNYLIEQCEDGQELQGHEEKKAELQQQLEGLQKQVEIVTAEGLVMDRVLSEDMAWDQDIRDYDSYTDCRWMGHRIWYTASSYEETFGHKAPKGVNVFRAGGSNDKNENIGAESDEARFAVWEIWDRVSNTIFTWAEGANRWAREPFQPENVGEQWFPFFPLGFHVVDGQFIPLSSVELLKGLQDEYNNTREDYAAVRKYNKPHYIADVDTKEQDIKKKTMAEIGEVIIVDANGRPLNEIFVQQPHLRIDPQQYDTTQIRSDFEFMSGLGDAARGSVAQAKTATEAEILEAGLAGRSNEMQDSIEDWMEDIAKYCAEIILQEMTTEQIMRLVGPGAVWPEMDKREIFELVNVEIRAGTTGKPNKLQEQKQWLEFLPQLQELFVQVSELRAKGDAQTADKLITIARETIRRLDERIDVEEFLPQEEGMNDQDMQAMQQQLDDAKRQVEQLEAEIRKTNSETVKNLADAGEKVAGSFMSGMTADMMPPLDQTLPAPMQSSPTPSAGDPYGPQ